jgi:CheY-like chemotaxis protein
MTCVNTNWHSPLVRFEAEARSLRILAAEDDVTNQLVIKSLLATQNMTPIVVSNGREALTAWEQENWDLVLMDVQMPFLGGLEAARAIRSAEQSAERPRTPIIAVTARAMAHEVEACRRAGMDRVVTKPIEIDLLFAAMDALLPPTDALSLRSSGPAVAISRSWRE